MKKEASSKVLKQPRNFQYFSAFENTTQRNVKGNHEEKTWWFRIGAAGDLNIRCTISSPVVKTNQLPGNAKCEYGILMRKSVIPTRTVILNMSVQL